MADKDKNLEIIEKLDSKMELALKEAKDAKAEALLAQGKVSDEVKQINDDLAKKGLTLEDIQKELVAIKAKSGRIAGAVGAEVETAHEQFAKGFAESFDKIKTFKSGSMPLFETKTVGTMTAAANLTGAVQISYASQPAVAPKRKLQFRDLVSIIPSATGLWQFYQANIPVGEGSFTKQTTHGAAKAQLDYDFTAVQVTADFLAGYARIARQMLQDLPFIQSYVSSRLVEDFLRAESEQYFGALSTAATGSTTTSASVTVEKIIDYVANLAASDYEANGIVVTPAVWATILKTKPNDYSIPGGVSITANGDVQIVGIPVFKSNNVTAGHVLVGDWSEAAIIQAEGLSVQTSDQDADNFTKNLVTVKAEAREGLAILRPDAFIYGFA